MVLTELAGSIALRLQRGSNRASLSWYPNLCTCLADGGHTRADGQLAHNEVGSTCRATRLSIIVGEQHSFLGHLVEVGRSPRHQAAMVGANIPHADIIAHDEQDIGFLVLSLGWSNHAEKRSRG